MQDRELEQSGEVFVQMVMCEARQSVADRNVEKRVGRAANQLIMVKV